jgi:hypothetical protein
MTLTSTLECPHCRKVGRTAKVISRGSRVRCSRCRGVFPFNPHESSTDDDFRSVADMDLGRLREFFIAEKRSAQVVGDDEPTGRYRGVTNHPFTPDPLFPASTGSKDRLIAGKPVRFDGPRKYTSVVLVVFLMMAGYAGIMWFRDWIIYLDTTGEIIHTKKKAKYAGLATPVSKPSPKPRSLMPAENRTVAGKPIRIDDLEVCVTEAREGQFQTEKRLEITLRITNLSKGPSKCPSWSQPVNGLTLRDRTPSMNNHSVIGPAAQSDRTLKPGETVSETLAFLPTPALFGLDLDLPLWGQAQKFQFDIPVEFIQRTR